MTRTNEGSADVAGSPRGAASDALATLDPLIHQAQRLRIMAALYRNREANFTSLRDGLGLTDGNLASHAQKLADVGYVDARRVLAGVSFEVRYRITPAGSDAFRAYVAQLRGLLADAAAEAGVP